MSLTRLSRNSLWLLLSRIGTQLGMALFTILLARSLGAGGFGGYAFMASVVVIGNVLTTFGTDMHLIREIAVTEDLAPLGPALLIQLVLSAIFISVVWMSSEWLPSQDPAAAAAVRIYSLSMAPLAFYTIFTTALRGRQQMLSYSLLNLALTAMQILAALWLHWRGGGLINLAILLLIMQIGGALLAGAICANLFPRGNWMWRFPVRDVFLLLRASAPIALLGLLGILYQRLSFIFLPALAGAAAAGWFSAGARTHRSRKDRACRRLHSTLPGDGAVAHRGRQRNGHGVFVFQGWLCSEARRSLRLALACSPGRWSRSYLEASTARPSV